MNVLTYIRLIIHTPVCRLLFKSFWLIIICLFTKKNLIDYNTILISLLIFAILLQLEDIYQAILKNK